MDESIKDIRAGQAFEAILTKFREADVRDLICAQCTACKPQRINRSLQEK
jgi:hypothetical protein